MKVPTAQIYDEWKDPFLAARAKTMEAQGEAAKVSRGWLGWDGCFTHGLN